jgi:translation initiation factor 4G
VPSNNNSKNKIEKQVSSESITKSTSTPPPTATTTDNNNEKLKNKESKGPLTVAAIVASTSPSTNESFKQQIKAQPNPKTTPILQSATISSTTPTPTTVAPVENKIEQTIVEIVKPVDVPVSSSSTSINTIDNVVTTTTTTTNNNNETDLSNTITIIESKMESMSLQTNEDGHWTPENNSAKKRYHRDFLLSLKDKKLSKVCPDKVKNHEAFADESSGMSSTNSMSFNKNSYQQQHFTSKQHSYGGNEHSKGSKGRYKDHHNKTGGVEIKLPVGLDKPLHKTATPYIPVSLSNKGRAALDENDEMLREVRNILNKLTPQNLNKLTADLVNLAINTEERLKGAIDIIFEKSIDEQVFSQTYAQLCKVLSKIKVPTTDQSKTVNFRTMLLTKCQKEFNTDYIKDINYDQMIADAEAETNEAKKKEMNEEANDKLLKAKRRSLGNIRFIGELFKLGMLTEGIMNDCIERLLKQETDEENLECLCRLLTTIGKELDKPVVTIKMNAYFAKLTEITKKGNQFISARIRFMILDVIELRQNKWVPRRRDAGPKRIDEIRKEAEEERLRLEAEIAKNQAAENNRRTGERNQGGKGSGRQNYNQSGYGQSLKSTSMESDSYRAKQQPAVSMVNKIADVKNITNNSRTSGTALTLGPTGGAWKTGATKNSFNKAVSKDSNSESDRRSMGGSTMPSSASTTSISSQQQQKQTLTPSYSSGNKMDKSRDSIDSNSSFKDNNQLTKVKMMDGSYNSQQRSEPSSQGSSRESSRDNSRSRISDTSNELRSYSIEEIERKVGLLVDEYIQNSDLSESLKDIDEFQPSNDSQKDQYVEYIIMNVLERTDTIRSSIGNLLYRAVSAKKIEIKHLTNGLKSVMEIAEDMSIDVPKISTYLGQIVAPMVQKDSSINFLNEACEPIKKSQICADFIKDLLNYASNIHVSCLFVFLVLFFLF